MKWHPLVQSGQSGATAEDNQLKMEHIRSLQNGHRQKLIDKMVQDNLPLVFVKVETYIGLHPTVEFLLDDLISAGVVGLIESIRDLSTKVQPDDGGNCTAYIGNAIVWSMCRLVDNYERQQIPTKYRPEGPDAIDPRDVIDTIDMIEAACESENDKIIVDMRLRGCTDEEISNRLDTSRRAVTFSRQMIKQRYDKLYGESL